MNSMKSSQVYKNVLLPGVQRKARVYCLGKDDGEGGGGCDGGCG